MKPSALSEAPLAPVHAAARQLRAALLSGSLEDLEESIPTLMDAAQQLRSLEKSLVDHTQRAADHSVGMRAELRELRKALDGAAWLVASGEALQQGWARLLGAAFGYTAGYTASGGAAALPSPLPYEGRIRVTG